MSYEPTDPHSIAARGADIYARKYRSDFERRHEGQFAAIDLDSEMAYLADVPEEALAKAKVNSPNGTFYLIRVGASGAYKLSRISNANRHRSIG